MTAGRVDGLSEISLHPDYSQPRAAIYWRRYGISQRSGMGDESPLMMLWTAPPTGT